MELLSSASAEGATELTDVAVNIRLLRGMPVKSILRMCENPSANMIVMDLTGQYNAVERFWGTISCSVAQKANCPVLLIPNGVSYAPLKKILYASNFESAD
ncbi:MAG: hypothetical protein ACI8YQ_002459 [Polaribacter sp.]|jgi:hypothetical protein